MSYFSFFMHTTVNVFFQNTIRCDYNSSFISYDNLNFLSVFVELYH